MNRQGPPILEVHPLRQLLPQHLDMEPLSGFYHERAIAGRQTGIIEGSYRPEAKRFKHWVTSEVLPSIRRTGQYTQTPSGMMAQALDIIAQNQTLAMQMLEHMEDNSKRCRRSAAALCYPASIHRTTCSVCFFLKPLNVSGAMASKRNSPDGSTNSRTNDDTRISPAFAFEPTRAAKLTCSP
jgi:hypothetical protein